MSRRGVACTSCHAPIAAESLDGAFHMCQRCESSLRVYIFPALSREASAILAEPTLIEGESSCFYHPQKKAVVACESCGRFLCALCDVEIGGVHRCPACLEAGKRKQQLQTLETEHIRYDRIALALTTLTFLFWPITLITAPAALFLVIRFWNRRSKILPGTRVIYVIAGLLALAEIGGWIFLFYMIFHHG
jgi:hypothetical protein